jgi:hypothetical protein
MPFFEGSKNFNINGGEMNEVGGNLVKNTTNNKTYNTDSFNTSTGSKISKGDKVSQNMNIGICLSGLIIILFKLCNCRIDRSRCRSLLNATSRKG